MSTGFLVEYVRGEESGPPTRQVLISIIFLCWKDLSTRSYKFKFIANFKEKANNKNALIFI